MFSADGFDPFKHTQAAPFVFVPLDCSTTCSSHSRGCDAALPAAAVQGNAAVDTSSISPSSRSQSPQRGWTPNIAWRSVSMRELRAHPAFVALPPPWRVTPTTVADLRLFRQDSQQWSAVHSGRITTSACASCLGLYEERSASKLGVPPSLRGRGKALDAHARLAAPLLSDLAMLHPDLWHDGGDDVDDDIPFAAAAALWRPCAAKSPSSTIPQFLCTFHPSPRQACGDGTGANHDAPPSINRIRMQWGSVQEATSILAALNYLGRRNAVMEEAGLQPLEALPAPERCNLPQGLPPIGASLNPEP